MVSFWRRRERVAPRRRADNGQRLDAVVPERSPDARAPLPSIPDKSTTWSGPLGPQCAWADPASLPAPDTDRICFLCLEDGTTPNEPLWPCCTRCSAAQAHRPCWISWRKSVCGQLLRGEGRIAAARVCSLCRSGTAAIEGEDLSWLEAIPKHRWWRARPAPLGEAEVPPVDAARRSRMQRLFLGGEAVPRPRGQRTRP